MKHLILTLLLILGIHHVSAQNIAVKTNMLYDASATVNMGIEFALGRRTTLDVSGNYNAWNTNTELNEKMRHLLIQPELRYYFCERMRGHFIGAHAHLLQYNMCGEHWLPNIFKSASTLSCVEQEAARYQGDGYGAGLVYGYDWAISNRLNLEFAVGAGYVYLDYEKYGMPKCAPYLGDGNHHYFGLTKLGVSLVYIIK